MARQFIVLHEAAIVHLPDYLSFTAAASLPCAAVTAWAALNQKTPLSPGQTVLVQGTGGVSLFALQIAKMVGARVLAITSSDEKAEKLKELGAEAVVNYSSQPDWEQEIPALTNGIGVDKVVDIAGEKTIVKSAASTRIGGNVALVGFASGMGGGIAPLDIMKRTLSLNSTIIGPRVDFNSYTAFDCGSPERYRHDIDRHSGSSGGTVVEWMEHVTDEQYRAGVKVDYQ